LTSSKVSRFVNAGQGDELSLKVVREADAATGYPGSAKEALQSISLDEENIIEKLGSKYGCDFSRIVDKK